MPWDEGPAGAESDAVSKEAGSRSIMQEECS
jgi:hypothetical protein